MSALLPPGPAWLFVPGDRPDRWSKAAARADTVIVDLENAVAPAAKARARSAIGTVRRYVDAHRLVVRVNAPNTDWYAEDVAAVRAAGVETVLVPKVHSRRTIERVALDLPEIALVALCETVGSVLDCREIAAAAPCTALMWGGEDLAVDLGGTASHTADGQLVPAMAYARTHLRYNASAEGVASIDAPVLRMDRPDWVVEEASAAASMGYHAKACIHPDQVSLVRAAFCPSEEELQHAAAVVAAADELTADDSDSLVPVFALDGHMIDYPVVALARQVIARASTHP